MDKSEYDFQIQHAEIDKEDIKYFKQWNHWGLCNHSAEKCLCILF
jgi:hypothetical protein